MGWCSGDFEAVNRRTMARFGEARGLIEGVGVLGAQFGQRAGEIIGRLGGAAIREAEKASEAMEAVSDSRNRRALEAGLAASGGAPGAAADAAALAGGDRSVVRDIAEYSALKTGVMGSTLEASLAAKEAATQVQTESVKQTADLLGQLDEAVDEGAGKQVAYLAGLYIAHKWDDIKESLMPDPLPPGKPEPGREATEVPTTDVSNLLSSAFPPDLELTPTTAPDEAIAPLPLGDPFRGMSTRRLGGDRGVTIEEYAEPGTIAHSTRRSVPAIPFLRDHGRRRAIPDLYDRLPSQIAGPRPGIPADADQFQYDNPPMLYSQQRARKPRQTYGRYIDGRWSWAGRSRVAR